VGPPVTKFRSLKVFGWDELRQQLTEEFSIFSDGGTLERNPSHAAFSDVCVRQQTKLCLMLSLGTGLVRNMQAPFDEPDEHAPLRTINMYKMLKKHMTAEYTSTRHEHRGMLAMADNDEYTWYKRLNPDGMREIEMDERNGPKGHPGRDTMWKMYAAVNSYLDTKCEEEHDEYDTPEDKLTQIAEKLLRQRHAKEQAYIDATPRSKKKIDVKFGKYVTGWYQEEQRQADQFRSRPARWTGACGDVRSAGAARF